MENRLTLRERFNKAYSDLINAGVKPKQISEIVGYKENASIFHLKSERYGYKLSLDKVEKMENYLKTGDFSKESANLKDTDFKDFIPKFIPDYKGEKY